ncbi:response regulator [Phenylobacterium sp.]|jgi:DNA-binding response OmpR family regulator|uniref:response regulator n=1 Tax=Phenylobacterium sp. TaxID=1871053 RepID=UPI002F4215D0
MDPELDTAAPLILLVEDDASVRQALTFALRIEGFAVEVHETAESMLERGSLDVAACVVIDHHLPGVSGIEALSEARWRGHACPAILITTQPKPEVRTAAARLKAQILEKPLLGGELPALIRQILG